jgi:hypothetical protein
MDNVHGDPVATASWRISPTGAPTVLFAVDVVRYSGSQESHWTRMAPALPGAIVPSGARGFAIDARLIPVGSLAADLQRVFGSVQPGL